MYKRQVLAVLIYGEDARALSYDANRAYKRRFILSCRQPGLTLSLIHIFLDDVRRLADSAAEELCMLEDRKMYLSISIIIRDVYKRQRYGESPVSFVNERIR